MIEKLKVYEETPSGYKHPENIVQEKINELVDVVNELVLCEQAKTCYELTHKDKTKDLYAEQRKWMWHLCRFWFDNKKQADIGILGEIDEDGCHPYWNIDLGHHYKYCEPVKPDDDIIYKGGKDE